jgi:hypothetical protein
LFKAPAVADHMEYQDHTLEQVVLAVLLEPEVSLYHRELLIQ